MKYAVIIDRAEHNYAAYAPELSGCVSTGDTWDEIQCNIREAIHHLRLPESLRVALAVFARDRHLDPRLTRQSEDFLDFLGRDRHTHEAPDTEKQTKQNLRN